MSLGDLTTVCVFFCWAGVGPKTKPLLAVGITEKEKGGVNKTKKVTLIIAKQTSLHLCHTKYSGDLKNQPFETQKHSKTRHVEDRILNGHLAIKKQTIIALFLNSISLDCLMQKHCFNTVSLV